MISKSEINKLTVPQKLALMEEIWTSINDEKIKITSEQKKELDRRLKKLESGQSKLYTWHEIKSSLRTL
jgi:putative addiction module component (TIGR02574 family)